MSDNHKQAYVEWVTGLDTEPPLEGAFNAGWHTRDAEVERLRETIAEWQAIHGTFTGDVHAACQVEIDRLRALLKARGPYCAQHGELQPCSQHNWGRMRSDYVEQD